MLISKTLTSNPNKYKWKSTEHQGTAKGSRVKIQKMGKSKD